MESTNRYRATGLGDVLQAQGRMANWLAVQIGVSKSQLSRVLSGERTLPEPLALRVADILQVPFFMLFELTSVSESSSQKEQVAA